MNSLYRLGEYEIDVMGRQLRLQGQAVALSGKPFDVLLALIDRAGQVVSKEELMEAVWTNSFVEEANLTQSISVLRKAFNEKSANARVIITVQGRGYQLGLTPIALNAGATQSPAGDQAAVVGSAVVRHTRRPAHWVTAAVLALTVVVVSYAAWRHSRPAPFTLITTRRLTNSGDVQAAAISPTGRYLAWVSRGLDGNESLSVSDLKNGGVQVLVRGETKPLRDLLFSPDEAFLYFQSQTGPGVHDAQTERRVPVLGGEPALVVRDTDGPVRLIERGTRLCFIRDADSGNFSFVSTDLEGGAEQTLATGRLAVPIDAECSPDGQRAAISGEVGGLQIFDFKSGKTSPLADSTDGQAAHDEVFLNASWDPAGEGLVTSSISPFDTASSLRFLTFPDGRSTAITHDFNAYRDPSLTSDGKRMVAVQRDSGLEFQSFEMPLPGLNAEGPSFRWSSFLGWMSDDTLIGSGIDGSLKQTDIATGHERPVPAPHGMRFLQPSGCGSDALVATGSRGNERALTVWYMHLDGSDLRQLSYGREDILPVCTSDGRWVVYADNSNLGSPAAYRVSSQGGQPQRVGGASVWFAISPDGSKLAWFEARKASAGMSLVVVDLVSGKQVADVPMPAEQKPHRALTWSADNLHVFFTVHGQQSDAVWQVGIDGTPPVKVIALTGRFVATIKTSPGGKRLGLVTTKPQSDAVLFEDTNR